MIEHNLYNFVINTVHYTLTYMTAKHFLKNFGHKPPGYRIWNILFPNWKRKEEKRKGGKQLTKILN